MTPTSVTATSVIAVDVGGTTVKGAVVDGTNVVLRLESATRASDGPDESFAAVEALIATLLQEAGRPVAGIGIAVPGTVEEYTGHVHWAENLDWRDLPVRERLAARFGLPIGFGHDVRTAALAEWQLGAGREQGDLVYLSVGTGIAAAIVAGGHLLRGNGWAGEVGHGGARTGESCVCGGVGCAETFASAAGMARRYRELSGQDVAGSAEVLTRAEGDDELAQQVWDAGVDRLGEIVATLVRVLGVRRVVVGGGMTGAGERLLGPLRAAARSYLTYHPTPEIVVAALGPDAGIHGAALLARQAGEDQRESHHAQSLAGGPT